MMLQLTWTNPDDLLITEADNKEVRETIGVCVSEVNHRKSVRKHMPRRINRQSKRSRYRSGRASGHPLRNVKAYSNASDGRVRCEVSMPQKSRSTIGFWEPGISLQALRYRCHRSNPHLSVDPEKVLMIKHPYP